MKHDPKYYLKCVKHGKIWRHSYLHDKFSQMKKRCYNPNNKDYKNYGARGIIVEDWLLDFHNYVDYVIDILPKGMTIEDMQKLKWSIDRTHNNEIYKRGNLNWASLEEQARNRRVQKNNTSGYQGVSWNKWRKKWRAIIFVNGKNRYLGLFDTREEAFAVYLEATLKYHGQKAYEHVLSQHPHWEAT